MTYDPNITSLLLEEYLEGSLSAEEVNRIEALLEADPALKEELKAMELAIEAVQHKGLYAQVKAIREEMMLHKPVRKKHTPVFSFVRRTLQIAAALVVVAAGFAIYKYITVTNTSVYNDLYLQYEFSRTRSVQTDPVENSYQQKNWNQVKALADQNPAKNKNQFLAGMASLETGNTSDAISRFESVLQKNASGESDLYNDEAEFYLALAYLKNGEPGKARQLLNTISRDAGHPYKEKALNASGMDMSILEWKDK